MHRQIPLYLSTEIYLKFRYVPAGRPISVKSPFNKNQVQWYKLTPNKQSIGSSLSVTFSSLTIGERVSYIAENQIEKADFTFHFIGVARVDEDEEAKTVYGVLGFPLKIQISKTIRQVILDNPLTDEFFPWLWNEV